MASKSRVPMQVSENFEKKVKELQKKIRKKTGDNISLREITENIINTPDFEKLENKILQGDDENIQLNLDRRRK